MKKNTKVLTVLLLFLVSTPVFASYTVTGESPVYQGITDRPFEFMDRRTSRLGGTGVALSTGIPALYSNPANLSVSKGFRMNLPNFNISLYGITLMMNDPVIKQRINESINTASLKPIKDNYAEILLAIMKNSYYNYTIAPFLTVQADAGAQLGPLAIDAFGDVRTNIYNLSGGMGNIEFVPSFSAGVALGLGLDFKLTNKFGFCVGASGIVMERGTIEGIRISDVDTSSSGSIMANIKNKKTSIGTSMPFNIGATVKLAGGKLRAGAVYHNLNSAHRLYNYGSFDQFLSNPFVGFNGDKAEAEARGYVDVLDSSTLDIGIGLNPGFKLINTRFEVDFVDFFSWKSEGATKDMKTLASHLKMGAEVALLTILKAGIGLNQGRFTAGLRLDLPLFVLDVDYGWVDSTPTLGEKLMDYISLSVKLGWDRTV